MNGNRYPMSSPTSQMTASRILLQRLWNIFKDGPSTEAVSLRRLFRYATPVDVFYMSLAMVIAISNGVAPPLLTLVFGNLVNAFTYRTSVLCSRNLTALSENHCTPGIILTSMNFHNSLSACNLTGLNWPAADFDFINETRKQSLYLVAIGFATIVLTYLQVVLGSIPAERQTRAIRQFLLRSIVSKEISYFDQHAAGELSTSLTGVVDKIHNGIGDKLGFTAQFMTSFVTGFVIGFARGWKLTLVILPASLLIFVSTTLLSKIAIHFSANELTAYGKAGAVAEEVFSSIRTVLCYNGQEREQKRYERCLDDAKKGAIKKCIINGLMVGMMWFIVYCSYALAFWYGAKLIREEDYNMGNVLTTFLAVIIGIFNLAQAAPYFQVVNEAKAAAQIVWKIIDEPSAMADNCETGLRKDHLLGDVSFSNVNFSYPSRSETQVLHGLSFDVRRGQTIALVGLSGSGKSTCVHLLQRLYEVKSGMVQIDGHRVEEYNLRWLRQQIGVVNQEPVLFQTTIRENILLGCESATDETIHDAAKMANAHDFIMRLPDQYETLVGQQGAALSGGQKQRIAIARALIRNPQILLLDEATSALDSESEEAVQKALCRATQNRTTLIIAHRLSTIRHADKIIVLHNGRVIEEGSHESLMNIRGAYFDLFEAQKLHASDEVSSMTQFDSVKDERKSNGSVAVDFSLPRFLTKPENTTPRTLEKKRGATSVMLLMNKPEWLWIIIGCFACLCNGAIVPALGLVLSKLIAVFDECDKSEQERRVALYALLFVMFGILYLIAMLLQNWMFAWSGEGLTTRIRIAAFRTILQQEMAFFDDPKHSTGALCTRLATDASTVQSATGVRFGGICQNLAALGMSVIIGFIFSWQLTLLVLVFMPFLVAGSFLQSRLTIGFSSRSQNALEEANRVASEVIHNIRTVIQLTKEAHFVNTYSRFLSIIHRASSRRAHVFACFLALTNSAGYFVMAAIFSLGSYLVDQGLITFETVLLVFTCIVFSSESVGQAASLAPDQGKATYAATKIMELLARNPTIDNGSVKGEEIPDFSGQLEFNHVHFVYPMRSEMPVLKNFHLEVKPGSHVALVGTSGSGKSTCIQLIERLYDVSLGCLLVDSKDVRSLNLHWYRSQIGLVAQEPVLFNMSIHDNIAYGDNGRRDVPVDEILDAAKSANIHEFIQTLPNGYQTNCGPKGTQLSGGQKQRIAIARALLRNPKLLLLDEATSALDSENEKVVQEALDRAKQNRTSITIAHRLSTIRNADVICVLHNGAIVESGTHQELLTAHGYYYRLIHRNFQV